MASLAEILAKRKAQTQPTPTESKSFAEEILSTVATTPNTVSAVDVEAVTKVVKEAEAKEKEQSDNFDDLLDAPIGKTNAKILEDAQITTADIVPRIRQLESLSDADLENEMKLLKAALMANPEAVKLMLPTDVGQMVVALRRITKEAVIAEATKKTTKTKSPKVNAKEIWTMEADDF